MLSFLPYELHRRILPLLAAGQNLNSSGMCCYGQVLSRAATYHSYTAAATLFTTNPHWEQIAARCAQILFLGDDGESSASNIYLHPIDCRPSKLRAHLGITCYHDNESPHHNASVLTRVTCVSSYPSLVREAHTHLFWRMGRSQRMNA